MSKRRGTVPSALTWAKHVTPRQFQLAHLDLYLLKKHDRILSALGWRSTMGPQSTAKEGGRSAKDLLLLPLILLPPAALFSFGGWGSTANGSWIHADGLDESTGLPVVVIAFLLTLPFVALVLWRWWTSARRYEAGGIIALVITALCAFGVLRNLGEWGVGVVPPSPASLTTWAALLLAGGGLLAIAVASNGRDGGYSGHFTRAGAPDEAPARELAPLARAGPEQSTPRRGRPFVLTRSRWRAN